MDSLGEQGNLAGNDQIVIAYGVDENLIKWENTHQSEQAEHNAYENINRPVPCTLFSNSFFLFGFFLCHVSSPLLFPDLPKKR